MTRLTSGLRPAGPSINERGTSLFSWLENGSAHHCFIVWQRFPAPAASRTVYLRSPCQPLVALPGLFEV
jgi:hypothetical protein